MSGSLKVHRETFEVFSDYFVQGLYKDPELGRDGRVRKGKNQ